MARVTTRAPKERKEVDLYSAYRQYYSTTERSDVDHRVTANTQHLCCMSHGSSQWEMATIDPTAPRPLDRFSAKMRMKYVTASRTRPRMQNFRGLCRCGWSGQIASLTHGSFCLFFVFRHAHRSHFRHTPAHNTSL